MNESITTKSLSSLTSADISSSLDSFSGELSEWINELIEGDDNFEVSLEPEGSSKRPVDLTELDNRVALLATKLEVTCQETSSQLERTIEDISRNVPRLNYDLQFMREGALALQRELNSVHQTATSDSNLSVGVVDETTMKALEQLRYLDAVKRGMEAARVVLQEAENWSTLEPEVTSLLKEGSYAKAASRLSEAAKSMSVFQHTPEFESRRNLMTNLQNQTEAAVSSALVGAINVRDVSACKEFHDIFARIEREGEFRNYYFGARRMGVLELWSNAKLLDVQGESADGLGSGVSLKFCELLARFFAELSTLVNEERSVIPSIFSSAHDPTTVLSLFIQSTLESLTPSLSQRISGMVAYHGPSALSELIKAFKMTEEFAVKVEKMMEKIALARIGALELTSPPREEPSLGKGHSRHKSKRLSVSRRFPSQSRATGGDLFDHTWQQALFEPFIDFQCEYVSLERRLLDSALSALHSSHKAYNQGGDSELKARMLREKAVDVFGMAEEALGRCVAFTHGYGAVECIHAVDQLFSQFFNAARKDLLQSPHRDTRATYSPDTTSQFEEELLSQAELVSFQLALNLLNTSRALKERLQLLDSKFRAEFTIVAQTLRHLILSTGGAHQSHNVAKGEMELLVQSTLNSMELNTLLENLDPLPPATPFFGSSQTSGYGSTPPTPAAASSGFMSRSEAQVTAQRVEPLLWGSFSALTEFARATQSFIQQLILSPLFQNLSPYSSLPVWSSTDQQGGKSKVYEFSIPTFSLSPTPSMQRVRDGLMALARTLLDYAGDDDALGFSLETLPFIERDAGVKEYLDWVKQNSNFSSDRGPNSSPRAKRKSISSPTFRRLSVSSTAITNANVVPSSTPPTNKSPPTLSSDTIYSAWLTSIILSLASHLTSDVLPLIQTLSTSGAAQLACDLEDLSNVVASVLNAEWEDLEKWKECCKMSPEDGRKRWLMVQGVSAFAQSQSQSQSQSPVDAGSIFKLVARMRGWNS
ncbi:hypothetical protein FRC18_003043 [Serendipita sp. 400]|nr:hypothetical protein FRC18_003043 [Serendipita sp. 400]